MKNKTLLYGHCKVWYALIFITLLVGCVVKPMDNTAIETTPIIITPQPRNSPTVRITITPKPTVQPTPPITIEVRLPSPLLISEEQAKEMYWVEEKSAFAFVTWASEKEWYLADSDTGKMVPYSRTLGDEKKAILSQFDIDEGAPYALSPDGEKLLYHRSVADFNKELWYANLTTLETHFVTTTSLVSEALPWFENIIWLDVRKEALLTRTVGESLQVWRFMEVNNEIKDWFDSFDQESQQILSGIAPTYLAISPNKLYIAFVAWSTSPGYDKLWMVNLTSNHIQFITAAYAGMAPFWSSDGRYLYFANGNAPYRFGAYDSDNPLGLFKYDFESKKIVTLISPGELGDLDIYIWVPSSNDKVILFSAAGHSRSGESGIWMVKLP